MNSPISPSAISPLFSEPFSNLCVILAPVSVSYINALPISVETVDEKVPAGIVCSITLVVPEVVVILSQLIPPLAPKITLLDVLPDALPSSISNNVPLTVGCEVFS